MGASPAPRPILRCNFCSDPSPLPGSHMARRVPRPCAPHAGGPGAPLTRCLEVAFIRKPVLSTMVPLVCSTISKPAAEQRVAAHLSRSLTKLHPHVGLWGTTAFGVCQMYLSSCVSVLAKTWKREILKWSCSLLCLSSPSSSPGHVGVPGLSSAPLSPVLKQGCILGPSRVSAPHSLPGQSALAQALQDSICVTSPGSRLTRKAPAEYRKS